MTQSLAPSFMYVSCILCIEDILKWQFANFEEHKYQICKATNGSLLI